MNGGAPVESEPQIFAPACDGSGTIADAPAVAQIVAQIIAIAHEGVDRAHRAALGGWEQEKRIIEILGLAARDAFAPGVRLGDGHAARENARRVRTPVITPS